MYTLSEKEVGGYNMNMMPNPSDPKNKRWLLALPIGYRFANRNATNKRNSTATVLPVLFYVCFIVNKGQTWLILSL
ncbi:hypothetical protein V6N13_031546 [Hibiscus sabdariffa]